MTEEEVKAVMDALAGNPVVTSSLANEVKRILKNYQRNDEELYKKFDLECRMLDLDEIFLPRNKTTYEWILGALQEKNIKCKGWMDDWNGKFEIRFQG